MLDSPKMTDDNSNEPWRALGVEPPPYAGEPTPENAAVDPRGAPAVSGAVGA